MSSSSTNKHTGGGGNSCNSPTRRNSVKGTTTLHRTSKRASISGVSAASASSVSQTNRSPEMQRRESLVKPTWQTVGPGQMPAGTMERLRKMSSSDSQPDGQQQQAQAAAQRSAGRRCSDLLVNNQLICPTVKPKNNEDDDEVYDVFGKVIMLGDSGVGKTCLFLRFRDRTFVKGNFVSTLGIDFRNKVVPLENVRVKLQIWDTAGQERFRSVTHAYYRDAHALLLLYDVTNKVSFDNIRAWLVEIREYAQEDVVIILLGNKSDCSDRKVRREEGERLARDHNVAFLETSAKSGLNVDLAFTAVARKLASRKNDVIDESRFNVQDYVKEQTHRTCPPCNM